MLEAPIVGLAVITQCRLGSLYLLEGLAVLEELFVTFLLGSRGFASHLSLDAPSLIQTDVRETLLAPNHFTQLHMLENHVDLLKLWIIDDLEQGYHVRVTNLLEDGDFLFRLILRRHGRDFAKAALLRKARDDLDGHILVCFQVASQLDFAVHPTANFFDHFILVDELPAREGI
jgi:hypothetical protein